MSDQKAAPKIPYWNTSHTPYKPGDGEQGSLADRPGMNDHMQYKSAGNLT